VAAGVAAGAGVLPRSSGAIDPQSLLDRYPDQPEQQTRQTLLTTRANFHQADEEALNRAFRRLRVAGSCCSSPWNRPVTVTEWSDPGPG